MKLQSFLLSSLLFFSHLMGASADHGVYYQELKGLKKRPETKILLDDKNAHQGLRSIHADVLEYKSSSFFQRFSRILASLLLLKNGLVAFNFFVVTPETMPQLYCYIEGVCKKALIPVPAIYITRSDWILNAFAFKLLASPGIVVISKKLIQELSDQAIEGMVTHELGHIKHNHTNKNIVIKIVVKKMLEKSFNVFIRSGCFNNCSRRETQFVYEFTNWILPSLIVGKHFEKQADMFAFEHGKAKGLIDFMKHMERREQIRENEFAATRELLKQNEKDLFVLDYYWLMSQYWLARGLHKGRQGLEWVMLNTFLDPHPSHESRIAAAEKYLAQQEA